MLSSPYMRLMRLHQPAGIWLLLWPCWWALALASGGLPPLYMLLLFALGSVLMRAAGCIVNDIADRKFDSQVERTRTRPMASGELSLAQAVALLALLLGISLLIAMLLGKVVVMWAALALIPVAIYPWMKRISWWPQLFLGLTFNWGALMGWAAVRGEVELPALLLYGGGIFWTLGYDTIYAHQDKKDDALIGIKSTALFLGQRTKPAVLLFYILAILLWTAAGTLCGSGLLFYGFMAMVLGQFLWQVWGVDIDSPSSCRTMFISNACQLGWLAFFAFLLAK